MGQQVIYVRPEDAVVWADASEAGVEIHCSLSRYVVTALKEKLERDGAKQRDWD